METNQLTQSRISEILARVREKNAAARFSFSQPQNPENTPTQTAASQQVTVKFGDENFTPTGKHGNQITYNKEQQEFIDLATSLKSSILIGAAGTGKTTCMMGAIQSLIHTGKIPPLPKELNHKHLYPETPGIVAVSYTRRAVTNLKKAMPKGMENNCITIHKLLEYGPVFYEVYDETSGEYKNTMRFEPRRNFGNPLPPEIKTIIIDESSMVSVELFKLLLDALPHPIQFIFLGDINQLPPIFGAAILGFKMLELPVVELTQVYRQALESPIIKYATQIRLGETTHLKEKFVEETPKGKITFHPWKKKLSSDYALATAAKFITTALDHGAYDPANDMILCPYNKAFGTLELNKSIANHISKKESRKVYEIIAGFTKLYLAVGDRVLYDKEDATVVSITLNGNYLGKSPQSPSVTLDYWGHDPAANPESNDSKEITDIDFHLEKIAKLSGKDDERVRAASHLVTVKLEDSEEEVVLDSASELNKLLLGYALTIHKSQGSEWPKVFVLLHQSHNTMIQRELLYTAVTRASKELYIICEPDTFVRGVESQRIKGNTLEAKAEYFKGRLEANGGSY